MYFLLLVVAYTGFGLIDAPGLIKKKAWRELIVYSLLMFMALGIAFLQLLHVAIPNPLELPDGLKELPMLKDFFQ